MAPTENSLIGHDIDPAETNEWISALQDVLRHEGSERAKYLLNILAQNVTKTPLNLSSSQGAVTTAYCNTIAPKDEVPMPGDLKMERKIRALIRWNAMAMVMKANLSGDDLGGHISSFQSSATLYDIGFNYFWRAPTDSFGGDLIYYQGHITPGIYARSFIEGRLSEDQLSNFRREVDGQGLSSYPHPWLMPDYWQFPTVSMGLGPIQAIYQAHVMKYMGHRELVDVSDRKVWAFLGDGECDEPESLGAISLAGREKLDNLIFVINCNLQRLDGPVRGNGKIMQELEGVFRGAGWNVIKVVWGRHWDKLLEKDKTGLLLQRMNEVVDGELQSYKSNGGAYTREHFFGKYPELLELVSDMTDDEIWKLNRGGHDPFKVYAAYHEAAKQNGKPTVILAQTVKGYGVGTKGQAQNTTHSLKKLDIDNLKAFRDWCDVPVADEALLEVPFYRPSVDAPEMKYMMERRAKLGGFLPQRRVVSDTLTIPKLDTFQAQLKGTGDREISTTMAFVRILTSLCKDKKIGKRIVPIVPDEARTFGMEGMFRQIGIYSVEGQKYTPNDSNQFMYYREDEKGQMLQEGINEAGAMSSWIAAATSYSAHATPLIPFYIFYSMFGFQRIGDLCWAAGDLQARGFLIGATSGRTTLNGEGLQHQDGHSHLMAATIPNCVSYDASYSYEVAVIVQDGMRRMYEEDESVFYYLTTLNENYQHPDMPEGAEAGILKGMYLLEDNSKSRKKRTAHVQLLGSGSILNEVRAAAIMLREDYDVESDVWAVTSYNELRREALDVERYNLLHPEDKPKTSYVTKQLSGRKGPVISSSDYMKSWADQIRAFVPTQYTVLGADGFGRSDSRKQLRHFFEVDRNWVVVATLKTLADNGVIDAKVVTQAIVKFGIDPNKPNPMTV